MSDELDFPGAFFEDLGRRVTAFFDRAVALQPAIDADDVPRERQALEQARARWSSALERAAEAAARYERAAAALARVDARIAVHLQHRDMVIEESGVTQLRGTFRGSRWVLVAGALLTTLGATLYGFGLPSTEPTPTVDVMRFTPGVPLPEDGTGVQVRIVGLADTFAACKGVLDGVIVDGIGEMTEVIVGEPEAEACRGRWLLPAGSWSELSGRSLPAQAEGGSTDPPSAP